MQPISFKRHRFPHEVIHYAVWLYFSLTLSLRDVEELLAQRGIVVSRDVGEQVRTADRGQSSPPQMLGQPRWHLDEMVVKIAGKRMWLWRAGRRGGGD